MDQFDELFKKKLETLGIKYEDTHWKKMEDLLVKKKKKKRAFFISFAVITTLVTGLFISMMLYFNSFNTPQESKLIDSPNHAQENTVVLNELKPEVKTDTSAFENADVSLNNPEQIVDNQENDKTHNQKQDFKPNSPIQSKVNTPESDKIQENEKESDPVTKHSTEDPVEAKKFEQLTVLVFNLRSINMLKIQNSEFNLTVAQIPLIEDKKSGKETDSIQVKSKWVHSLAGSYEYDMYRRKENDASMKANEKTLNRSGFNIHYAIRKNNLGFKTGLGFLQLFETTSYLNEHKSYAYDTSYRMINPTYAQTSFGSKLALINREIDSTESINYTVDCPDCQLQLTYIKIPLLVSYEFKLKKMSLFVDAGINTSILAEKKGSYTTYENNQFVVKDVKQSEDMNRYLFQTYTAIGIKYHIFNKVNIFGGYGISNSINSMVKSYNQKPVIHQFSFGLGVDL